MSALRSSTDGTNWYIADGDKQLGPFPQDTVVNLLQDGKLPDHARFSSGGPWISRAEIEGLFGIDEQVELIPLDPVATVPGVSINEANQAVIQSPRVAEPQAAMREAPETTEVPDAVPPTRDRIVVIGRRASGKTVYLAELYHQLWRSHDGLSMKALSGQSHKELMTIHETLRRGEWPAATEKTTVAQTEFEVQYHGRKRVLVSLDYAGEVFRDAFVNDDLESPQAKALISHIDRAAAVILLVDPSIAVSNDAEAVVDDDYGVVQAIQRIRDWPRGEDVPVVLLFTKYDQNRRLFVGDKSIHEFVRTHYPALLRTLKRFKVLNASAVQTTRDAEGRKVPKTDSTPINIMESLKYCLDTLEGLEERIRIQQEEEQEQRAMENMVYAQQEAESRYNRSFAIVIAAIITMAACIMVLILIFKG